jgi:hypothetical protein
MTYIMRYPVVLKPNTAAGILSIGGDKTMTGHFVIAQPTTDRLGRSCCPTPYIALACLLNCLSLFAADQASLRDFDSLAIQGDAKAGLAIIDRIPANSLTAEDQKRRAEILSRFRKGDLPQIEVNGPLTRDVAGIYLKYWRRCLLREVDVGTANADLYDNLQACLNTHKKDPGRFSSLNDLTEALGPMLLAEGVHSIRGVTAPYYELMLWNQEDARPYTVELPESTEQVKVMLLSGFVLKGWVGFATCDKEHSSGWTTKDTLYCVRDSYDLDSEPSIFLIFADFRTSNSRNLNTGPSWLNSLAPKILCTLCWRDSLAKAEPTASRPTLSRTSVPHSICRRCFSAMIRRRRIRPYGLRRAGDRSTRRPWSCCEKVLRLCAQQAPVA